MNTRFIFSIAICMTLLFAISAGAEQSLLESTANGCKTELDTYCKDVTPGEGRMLACLYSRSDKLSGKCEYALYDAAVILAREVDDMTYAINECSDDLSKLCRRVEAGEGRLMECLDKNDSKVSKRCKNALKEVGLKE